METGYKAYTVRNIKEIKQLESLPPERVEAMEAVAKVLPFRTNNYVTEKLIDWNNIPEDPIFQMTFPQPEMLEEHDLKRIMNLETGDRKMLEMEIMKIRRDMNPHPAGQLELNVPELDGKRLNGLQHKYNETVLFFPEHGQTCHAFCTYCFRWAQFIGDESLRMASEKTEVLIAYLNRHPEVTDLLVTGGDPMFMRTKLVKRYLEGLIKAKPGNLKNIRIGTKALSYWPYRFTKDSDSRELLDFFSDIVKSGFHLTIMAHFTHPVELETSAVEDAVSRLLEAGAAIRCQSPILKHINADSSIWSGMWEKEVEMGMIPYYMFVARDTGPKGYFDIPLEEIYRIFSRAYSSVSGLSRTVRGPSMSTLRGKIVVEGITGKGLDKKFVLKYIQSRDPDLVNRIFFAEYNPDASWITDLTPASKEDELFF